MSSSAAASGSTLARLAAERARRGEREHGADPLAARQQRVAHRLLEAHRGGLVGEAQTREVGLHLLAQVLWIALGQPSASCPDPAGSASPARTWRSSSTLASPASRAHSSTTAAARSGSSEPARSSAAARSRRSVSRSSCSDGTRSFQHDRLPHAVQATSTSS